MSTNPGGRIWVDPDGVESLGKAYDGQAEIYETYLQQLTSLRARYAKSWGDDDMGEQFSTKFLQGMDNLEALIGGIKGTLRYTAQGLREGGQAYREADEAAAEVGRKMAKDFDQLGRPVFRTAQQAVQRAVVEPVKGEMVAARAVQGKLLGRVEAKQARVVEGKLQPMERGEPRRAQAIPEIS